MGSIRVLVSTFLTFFLSISQPVWANEYELDYDFFGISEIKKFVVKNISAAAGFANSIVFDASDDVVLTEEDRKEIGCLARAMYFESRGEPLEGRLAVAHVIFNRIQHDRYPDSVCGVVRQKTAKTCQFSWYCDRSRKINQTVYRDIEELAQDFYLKYDEFEDFTLGALYFHADYVRSTWRGLKETIKIGRHIFYRPKERARKK